MALYKIKWKNSIVNDLKKIDKQYIKRIVKKLKNWLPIHSLQIVKK